MRPLTNTAGQMLRTLRIERGLTLEGAAVLVGASIASLSRKERGVDGMNRDFLRHAAEGYGLSPWEAQQLWTAAGFLSPGAVQNALPGGLRSFAAHLLTGCPYPAIVTDALGYILAWNQADEFAWQPSAVGRRPHLVRAMFTPAVRAHLGEQWETTARRGLETFYAQTLPSAGRPDFQALLAQLRAELGEQFADFWRAAQQKAHTVPDAASVGQVDSLRIGAETAHYVVAQTAFQAPVACTLSLYLPLDARSAALYARLRAGMGPNAVYFAADVP